MYLQSQSSPGMVVSYKMTATGLRTMVMKQGNEDSSAVISTAIYVITCMPVSTTKTAFSYDAFIYSVAKKIFKFM